MPNALAFIAVFSWPLAVYLLFRYLPRVEALCWSILGGYLLLPTRAGVDLPLVPAIDKDVVPALTAALMLALGMGLRAADEVETAAGRGAPGGRPGWLNPFLPLFVLLLMSPLITVLTNSEPLSYGPLYLPGLRIYDAASIIGRLAFSALPFILAMRYLASPESHVTLLKVIVVGMLIYSLPALFEIRMSPQLNVMFFGFFPHEFQQHMRAGGFRPVVFLHHGLWLSLIFCMAVIAAAALWRQRIRDGARAGQWLFAGIYLLLVLFLSNSLGAFVLALLLAPAVLFLGLRGQFLLAGVIAVVVLVYPVMRSAGLIPVDFILEQAGKVSAERAQSFEFRLDNEDMLGAWAAQKPFAGWGIWGRNEVYDPETGRSLTVTDGYWIIVIGVFGWLGYIAQFGLFTLPTILLAFGRRAAAAAAATPATAGLSVVLATNLIDLLPNATLSPITWLIGGAIAGHVLYRAPEGRPDSGPAPVNPKRSWGVLTDRPRPLSGEMAQRTGGAPSWHRTPRAASRQGTGKP